MRSLKYIIFITLLTLTGCGGDSPPSSNESQIQNPDDSEGSDDSSGGNSAGSNDDTPDEISLDGQGGDQSVIEQQVGGETSDGSVVDDSFANVVASLRQSNVSEGNLTIGVSAADPDGITQVLLFVPSVNRSFTLCEANCGSDFQVTLTGLNPHLMGALPGSIRFELFVGDVFDNLVGADAVNVNWQPIQISGVSATREDGIIQVNWTGSSLLDRYNFYAATQHGVNSETILTLDNGFQQLAILGTQTQFNDADPSKEYHVLLTGIDAGGESGLSQTLTIPRADTSVNQAPVAATDQYQIEEEQPLATNIIDNDSDANGQIITLSTIIIAPTNGSVTFTPNGQIVYQPLLDFVGQDSFIYEITDSEGATAQGTVEINISAVNDNPVANDDTYTLNLDKSLTISFAQLLENDSDVEADLLTVLTELAIVPSFGTININNEGSFSYQANNEFIDNDSFVYQVSDGQGGLSQAKVFLLLNTSVQEPLAIDDSFQTNEDATLIVNLAANGILANDSDPDDRPIQLVNTLVELPQHGQLNLADDGTFSYIPDSNFFGVDQFEYQIINNAGVNAQAVVTINVLAQVDAPIANNNNYQINEDNILNVSQANGLLSNDLDPDLGTLTVSATPASGPSQGSLTLFTDGSFSYQANNNFHGIDSFSYQVENQSGQLSTAQVFISVLSINDIPVADVDNYSVDEDNTLNASSVLLNDRDADGDTLIIDTTPVVNASKGSLNLFADGTFTYLPTTNSTGSDTFTYSVSDGIGGAAQAVVSITVNAINDNPTAVNDSYSLNEDTTLNDTTLLANDNDIDGDSLTLDTTPTINVSNGSLTLNSGGSFSYAPNSGFFGNDTFSYQILDGNGGTSSASVALTVISVNDIPVAEDDDYTVDEDNTLNGNSVLLNDSDDDGDALIIETTPVINVSSGNLTLFANGTFSYLADGDFNGTDNFTYRARDGHGGTDTASVTITVNAINDAPTANSDSYSLLEDSSLSISGAAANRLLINDNDVDGDVVTLSTTPVDDATNGNLTLNSDGSFVYSPSANFSGNDSFTYQITDGKGASASTSVALTITNINDAPVASNDSFTMTNGFTLSAVSVLTNDSDFDADTLTINTTPVISPSSGSLVLAANGTFTYTPITDGVYNFTYQVNDGKGLNDTGDVTITVNSNNTPPIGVNDSYVITANHVLNGSTVLINDTDAENNTLMVNTTPIVDTTNGNLTLNVDGSFSYTPDANYVGIDTFTYELNDGSGGISTAVVFLNINPNTAPSAVNDSYQMDEDSVLTGTTVLINDVDAEGDTLTIKTTAIADISNGSLTINADGSFIYTPNANFTGVDSFTYEVDDGKGSSDQAVVSITVDPVNDLPIGVTDSYSIDEDNTLNGSTVLANDSDIDGDTLTIDTLAISTTTKGLLTLSSDGTFVYSPNADANGSDSFIYQIHDGEGGSAEATVNIAINSINDDPVAVNDSFNMIEETVLTLTVGDAGQLLANDSDADGDSLSVNITPDTDVNNGSLTLVSDGGFTYTPNVNFFGVDSFIYQLEDGKGGVTTGSVSITVSNINDDPKTVNDDYSTNEDIVLNGSSVLSNDSDIDGDSLSLITSTVSGPSNGIVVLNSNGSFIYTPNVNFFGDDSFDYQVSDGHGGSANGTVNITINTINDPPVANSDNFTINEDSVLSVSAIASNNILSNDNDADGDTLTVNTTPIDNVSNGSLSLSSDGAFIYTPAANFSGSDNFTYQISDGKGESSQAQVNIIITEVNDQPIASDQVFTLAEDKTHGDSVGTVVASDIEGNSLSFAIVGGDASLFNIESSSGQITVNGITPLNFENIIQHAITLEITDDGSPNQNTVISVTINIDDVLESVVPTELASFGRPAATFFELTGEHTQAKFYDSHRDGDKIYFVGSRKNIDQDIYMIVYKKDGTLDTGFGTNGEQVFDFGHHETVQAIAEKGGKYYLAFESFNGVHTEICFIKVDNNGDIDTNIGTNGVRCTDEKSDLSVNDMIFNGSDFFAVGRKRTTDDDLLIIQMDDELVFTDHTPGDLTDSPHIITDVSGASRDDEGLAVFEPDGDKQLITGSVRNGAGDLDMFAWLIDKDGLAISSFNGGIPATYDIGGFDDVVQAVGGKSEGDFTAHLAGYTTRANGKKEAAIIAIDNTGILSTNFTPSGIATYDADGDGDNGDGSSEFTGIVFDSDNLYLSGSLNDENDQNKHFATRVNSIGGTVDSATYASGSGGYRKVSYATDAFALSMSLDGDKTSWLSGYRQDDSEIKMIITAIDSDGNKLSGDDDGHFSNGKKTINYTSTPSDDSAVKVLKITNGIHAGKFIVASTANASNSNDIVISRFTSAGALDTSFDYDGHKQVKLGTDVIISNLLELSSGDFILVGTVTEASVSDGVIARLDSEANVDTTFANNGIYTTASISATNITFNQVAVDNSGNIIAIGGLESGSTNALILRLSANGSLDTTFNAADTGGYITGSVLDEYYTLVIDSSDNIIVAGNRNVTNKALRVLKYNSNGVLDGSFANSGTFDLDINVNFDDSIAVMLTDTSNNLYLLGGEFDTPNQVVAVKISPSGTLDNSFSGDGQASFVMAPANENALLFDAKLDSNNNVIIAGQSEISSVNTPMLGRIKPDGTLDSMFNSSGFFNATSCSNAAQFNSLLLLDDENLVVAGHCYIDTTFKNNLELTQYQLLEP